MKLACAVLPRASCPAQLHPANNRSSRSCYGGCRRGRTSFQPPIHLTNMHQSSPVCETMTRKRLSGSKENCNSENILYVILVLYQTALFFPLLPRLSSSPIPICTLFLIREIAFYSLLLASVEIKTLQVRTNSLFIRNLLWPGSQPPPLELGRDSKAGSRAGSRRVARGRKARLQGCPAWRLLPQGSRVG